MYYLIKIAITAVLVVVISEVAKRWSFLGAVLASLPITSLLAIMWLYIETKDRARVADFSLSIVWVVIPSLVFFVSLFFLLKNTGWNFWASLAFSIFLTASSYLVYLKTLVKMGIEL